MENKKDFIEQILGGIFGVVAVIAAICEMCANGISTASILGCIKDVFGTLTIIILFFAIVKDRIPSGSFRQKFEKSMELVEKNYQPLIKKYVPSENEKESFVEKNKKVIRYDILDNIENLFSHAGTGSSRVFEMEADHPSKITFFVRAKFFGRDADLEAIADSIDLYLSKYFPDYVISHGKDSIEVNFPREMVSANDAEEVVSLIDTTIMLYIAKNKR